MDEIEHSPHRFWRRFLVGGTLLLLFPIAAGLIAWLILQNVRNEYQEQHTERIFTGVFVWNNDVGGLTRTEAAEQLNSHLANVLARPVTIVDNETGEAWRQTLSELGVTFTVDELVESAYQVGRSGTPSEQNREQALVWYQGIDLGGSPAVSVDSVPVVKWVSEIAGRVDRPMVEPALVVDGTQVDLTAAQQGRELNREALQTAVLDAISALEEATIPLSTINLIPADSTAAAVAADLTTNLQQVIDSTITFYVDEPQDDEDLVNVELSAAVLSTWITIDDSVEPPKLTVDEEAAREWIKRYATKIIREPVRARFYFDDLTSELVLIEPHVNGRRLDVDGTLAALLSAIENDERNVPFAVRQVVPTVHSDVTGAELGIVEELVGARRSTSFWDSPPERRHNIARAAQNFYGIVIAPDEEFSFNQFLGEVSEAQGYEEGLIIAGGQTTKEVGGGICQVSTTLYQAAFWGGFTLGKRQEHGYRVPYYESNPMDWDEVMLGMDATVYSPLIDFTFTNNTPHHLLIENYFDGVPETLTVKFYSTNIGRTVDLSRTIYSETDQTADKCKYNPDLEFGEVKQTEWGIGGADVLVERYVFNQWGEQREYLPIQSDYFPTSNLYEYGDGVDPDLICPPAESQVEADATPAPDESNELTGTPDPEATIPWWVTPESSNPDSTPEPTIPWWVTPEP